MVEREKAFDECVEVVGKVGVLLNPVYARCGEIGLTTAATRFLAVRASWFVIENPIALRGLDLPQVGARKMVPLLREIVVGRIDLCRENGFDHGRNFCGRSGAPIEALV